MRTAPPSLRPRKASKSRSGNRDPVRINSGNWIEWAGAGFGAEEVELAVGWIDEAILHGETGGQGSVEGTPVLISATSHLRDELLVPLEQGAEPSLPAHRFGVPGVAGAIQRQHVPDRVEFAVLTKQMRPAKERGIDIPNAHATPPFRDRRSVHGHAPQIQ